MSTRPMLCARCKSDLYVRVEWILSGRRMSAAYYCGRCHHEWRVETVPPAEVAERRVVERRKQNRAATRSR